MSRTRLLVAVSSPWASEKLTAPIADLAGRLEAEVVVAHVARLQEEDESEADATQRGEQTLHSLSDALKQAGVEADSVMLLSDDIARAILNTAHARQCTMIVVGLAGRGLFRRLIRGDVPGNLMRQSDLPVLVCPANWSQMI